MVTFNLAYNHCCVHNAVSILVLYNVHPKEIVDDHVLVLGTTTAIEYMLYCCFANVSKYNLETI